MSTTNQLLKEGNLKHIPKLELYRNILIILCTLTAVSYITESLAYGFKAVLIFVILLIISKEYLYFYLTKIKKINTVEARDLLSTTYPEIPALITFLLLPIGIPLVAVLIFYPISIIFSSFIFLKYKVYLFNNIVVFILIAKTLFSKYFLDASIKSFTDTLLWKLTKSFDKNFNVNNFIVIEEYNFDLSFHKIIFVLLLSVLLIMSVNKIIDIKIPFNIAIVFSLLIAIHLILHILYIDKPSDSWSYFTERFRLTSLNILTLNTMIGIIFVATEPTTSPFKNSGKIIYCTVIAIVCCFMTLMLKDKFGIIYAIFVGNLITPLINKFYKEDSIKAYKTSILICFILIGAFSYYAMTSSLH